MPLAKKKIESLFTLPHHNHSSSPLHFSNSEYKRMQFLYFIFIQ